MCAVAAACASPHRRRYWLFNISALDRRLLVEDPVAHTWATYETPEEVRHRWALRRDTALTRFRTV